MCKIDKEFEARMVEYKSIRDSIESRVKQRGQIVAASIAIFSTLLLAVYAGDRRAHVLLFVYPLVALIASLQWKHTDRRIWRMAGHIFLNIEKKTEGMSWYAQFKYGSFRWNVVYSIGIMFLLSILSLVIIIIETEGNIDGLVNSWKVYI